MIHTKHLPLYHTLFRLLRPPSGSWSDWSDNIANLGLSLLATLPLPGLKWGGIQLAQEITVAQSTFPAQFHSLCPQQSCVYLSSVHSTYTLVGQDSSDPISFICFSSQSLYAMFYWRLPLWCCHVSLLRTPLSGNYRAGHCFARQIFFLIFENFKIK